MILNIILITYMLINLMSHCFVIPVKLASRPMKYQLSLVTSEGPGLMPMYILSFMVKKEIRVSYQPIKNSIFHQGPRYARTRTDC